MPVTSFEHRLFECRHLFSDIKLLSETNLIGSCYYSKVCKGEYNSEIIAMKKMLGPNLNGIQSEV